MVNTNYIGRKKNMITSIADLKNRTMVESNTLKSFILSEIGG